MGVNAECVKGLFFIPDRCQCNKGFIEEDGKCIQDPNGAMDNMVLHELQLMNVYLEDIKKSTARCEPESKRGICTGFNTCTCEPGWTGELCNQRSHKLLSNDCGPAKLCGCNPEDGMETIYYKDANGCENCKCVLEGEKYNDDN